MAQIDTSKLARPIVTGTPQKMQNVQGGINQNQPLAGTPFLNVLKQKLEMGSNTAFSKHAVSRVAERQIDVSQTNLQRLDQGMRLAQQKGLGDALILIDENAYIVNAHAGKVITVDTKAEKGSVFTNIDGTVIV